MTKRTHRVKVAVLGGGIGGLTVAHELAEFGGDFEVHVYESGESLGGKAASQSFSGTGMGGRDDLPGEHGFRFFPGWYKHIPDTMRRTPRPEGGTVADSLIGCTEMAMAEPDARRVHRLRRHVLGMRSSFEVLRTLEEIFAEAAVPAQDVAWFTMHILEFMQMCEERRRAQYESVSFYDFVDGPRYSPRFQRYLNSSRFMVAMDMRHGSACTIGNKLVQMLLDFFRPEGQNDRVLNGPTTSRWIDPWAAYLRSRGVRLHLGRSVTGFRVDRDRRRVIGVDVAGEPAPVTADYYVAAMPIERMQALINDDLAALDEVLVRLRGATRMTSWMVGAQYYLREEVRICDGHVAYPASPWALSSISQVGFWNRGRGPADLFHHRYGDGLVRGLLSVDISDWETVAPRLAKAARQCMSRQEVLQEVWEQLKEGLNRSGEIILADENLVCSYLDAHVRFSDAGAENDAPLLVHPPGSWYERPPAILEGIQNLMLAADYIRTGTDLATMEGANEAGRAAVNGILSREGRRERVEVFLMHEDAGPLFRKAKAWDRWWWVERRRAPPALVRRPGPYRAEGGPTLEDVRRYEEQLARALEELDLPGT